MNAVEREAARARRLVCALYLILFVVVLPVSEALGAPPSQARVIVTARDTRERLSPRGALPFAPLSQPTEDQCALTDAAAETFMRLSPVKQQEFIRACYDIANGLGYSLGRTNIHSCDFSSESYTYVRDGDTSLSSFTLDHDRKARIPFIKRVLVAAPTLKIFASPWSPPGWMKTNGEMLHGGSLKPEHAGVWARYVVRFLEGYAREGIALWGLTVQNEPMASQTWESCIYTGEQERDFVKKHLGPALAAAGLGGVRLMIWDHNRGMMAQRAAAVLDDPEAAKYVWGTAFHWYGGDDFSTASLVHDAYPDKALLFSEGCNYPFSWKTFNDWSWGEGYGRSMIGDFNHWASGWCDWNVLLDERGGPNHVNNFCFAPVHADAQGQLHYMASYYYIGHFSRYVRPGARRVSCSSSRDDLLATAFVNPDQSVAAVAMNPTDKARDIYIWTKGQAVKAAMPAHSIATFVW
ncbi:MAG: glycosyl hydrolase [Proteobacteria bacterium]|nr:glycosyl hydrolase [Pseudomonadota bacterium]